MTKSGILDFEKIAGVKAGLDLRKKTHSSEWRPPRPQIVPAIMPVQTPETARLTLPEPPAKRKPVPPPNDRTIILHEFEKIISQPSDMVAELIRVGGKLHAPRQQSRPRLYAQRKKTQITVSAESAKHSSINVAPRVELPSQRRDYNFGGGTGDSQRRENFGIGTVNVGQLRHRDARRKQLIITAPLAMLFLAGALLYRSGLNFKNEIVQDGNRAVANLEQAKENLAGFDFLGAADRFALAYDNFNQAASSLNNLGASFFSNFGNLPGLEKLKSANNLTQAGKLLAKAGENLSLAAGAFARVNIFSSEEPAGKLIGELKEVLVYADKNINQAHGLLTDIDTAFLPSDKQPLLVGFREKIPEFQQYIGSAIDYTDFLLGVVGGGGTRKYLVLLQNNSELRATGGFPGSYALVTFTDGILQEVVVDDVYNIDGQLKENIVPPRPLQHITLNWGMRDANWFADFPSSARKVQEFYLKDGGSLVNGVLTITPDVIEKIIAVAGPIEMPEYGLTLSAENFLVEIQREVEYGQNRVQPKTILKEFQPRLFTKLKEQNSDRWLKIFQILAEAAAQKHILAYFNDPELEKFAVQNGLGGEMKSTDGDYLQVVFSNVKGSKTDAVIDNRFNLTIDVNQSTADIAAAALAYRQGGKSDSGTRVLNHQLIITRKHNGGNSQYGFYNKVNPTYIRVYVPKGSVLESIEGHALTNYRPLVGYEDYNFGRDPELDAIEATTTSPFAGVDVFEESDKTVFGFWLLVKPGENRSAAVNYQTPLAADGSYHLLWQKQSGTGSDIFRFSYETNNGKSIVGQSEGLQIIGGKAIMNSDLSIDREIKAGFQ